MSGSTERLTIPPTDLHQQVGQTFVSNLFVVDQARIDAFAKVTEDEQFIHVDPEQARLTPFGGTVAHGFLTLSLLSPMAYSALPKVEGATIGVITASTACAFRTPCAPAPEWQLTYEVSVEIEGAHKPALAATWLTMQVTGTP